MPLSKDARSRLGAMKREYGDALAGVAEHLAAVEGHETQLVSHLERARTALTGGNLDGREWWRRPAVWREAGAIVVSVAIAWFGVAFGVLCPGGRLPTENLVGFWSCVVAVPVVILVAGLVLVVAGWANR